LYRRRALEAADGDAFEQRLVQTEGIEGNRGGVVVGLGPFRGLRAVRDGDPFGPDRTTRTAATASARAGRAGCIRVQNVVSERGR
jgi:hypothetical protein